MDEITLLREFRADVDSCDEIGQARARAALRAQFAAEAGSADRLLETRRRLPLVGRQRFVRFRWTRVVALAAVVGVGVGFGLASWLTPSGSATSSFVGFGFLPANGWTVVQSGTVGATGAASAIAANVPLDPGDRLGSPPFATLESLPSGGVLIFATFTTRGDPGEDVKFAVRELPLQISGAKPVPPAGDPLPFARHLAQYRLRVGVEGYNVDARIYFGTAPPSDEMIGAAQRQLNRLVVASERVTIFARPSIARGDGRPVTLFGSVDNGKAGEVVDIQARDCGQQFFRGVAGATTREGGGWSTEYFPGITTTIRAVWNGEASAQITVRQRPRIELLPPAPGAARRFKVDVVAKAQFWRRQVIIQRFDRRLGTWVKLKSVVLTEQGGAGVFVVTSATFGATVPKGTLIRAVFPLAQARPCYLAGFSNLLRT